MESISLAAARRLRQGQLPHVPPAAAPVSTRVRLDLQAPAGSDPEVILTDTRRGLSWRVALSSTREKPDAWYTELLLPSEPTVITYHFTLADGSIIRERRQVEGIVKPLYGVWEERDFRIAVYTPHSQPPNWVRGLVMYQIFPDRFAIGNPANVRRGSHVYGRKPRYLRWGERPEHPPKGRDFFGGDLPGIISKLDYLADLGITCLYLTPIFAAPTNHRYDTLDYFRIDPRLGDETDFRTLVIAAAEHGIRIILDGVFNHCSSESVYFKAAQADKTSPFYRWFDFQHWPDKYTGWVGVREMPEFVECPEVEEFFFGPQGVARYWLRSGISGWRLDVTPWISDEYWRRFRRALRADKPDVYLIAEDWGDATPRLVGDTFDATMNYRFAYSVIGFATGQLSPSELDDRLETLRRDTPEPAFHAQMNLLGSHDTPRLLTLCSGDRGRHMLTAAFQLAYPGVPMIYYGDEAGLEGEYAEDGRRAFPWDAPDQLLLNFYRRAIHARRASVALSLGTIETVWIDDATSSYGFLRTWGEEQVLALFNAGDTIVEVNIMLPNAGADGHWIDLLGRLQPAYNRKGQICALLPPCMAGWFVPQIRTTMP